jgi:hypothetical protein
MFLITGFVPAFDIKAAVAGYAVWLRDHER